jgi:hypothetical protein
LSAQVAGIELDLTQVRAFVEVAEQHHFGRAAARLFLTQQALSKRIQRLEHTVGEPLLHRGARGVQLERAVAAVSAEHRLADAPLLDPADLKDSLLWMPAAATSSELLGVWRRFAEHFGIAMDTGGQNLGLEHAVDQLRRDPRRFALFGRDWRVPAEATIRLISLEPTPCYLWSLVWREGDRHPLLGLLQQAVATGRTEGWLAYDPARLAARRRPCRPAPPPSGARAGASPPRSNCAAPRPGPARGLVPCRDLGRQPSVVKTALSPIPLH